MNEDTIMKRLLARLRRQQALEQWCCHLEATQTSIRDAEQKDRDRESLKLELQKQANETARRNNAIALLSIVVAVLIALAKMLVRCFGLDK